MSTASDSHYNNRNKPAIPATIMRKHLISNTLLGVRYAYYPAMYLLPSYT